MSYEGNKPPQATVPLDDAVTTAMLKDDAVTSAKIDDGTIATADIADDAVTVAITPTGATSKILVWASFGFYVVASSRGQLSFRIFENSTSTSIVEFNDRYFSTATTSQPQNSISGKFDCVDTSALSFRVQAKIGSGSGVSYYYPLGYGTQTMTIIAMEIGA